MSSLDVVLSAPLISPQPIPIMAQHPHPAFAQILDSDSRLGRMYEVYRRTASVYNRANSALGRQSGIMTASASPGSITVRHAITETTQTVQPKL